MIQALLRFAGEHKIVRFFISGGSAAATNLGVLYICHTLLGIWYITASIIAFVVSFIVSFTMQKFWTFDDKATHMLKSQMAKYLTVITINLGVNTTLLFIFVEYVEIPVFPAQILTMLLIAGVSFFVYQHLIFTTGARSEAQTPK